MNVSHSHRRTKRRWNPNVQRVRALVNGAPKRLHVCTSCIRAGKVTKPVRRNFASTSGSAELTGADLASAPRLAHRPGPVCDGSGGWSTHVSFRQRRRAVHCGPSQ